MRGQSIPDFASLHPGYAETAPSIAGTRVT